MADVTINQLTGQAPTDSDVFPFSTTGVTPATYKASLSQIKTALAIPPGQIQSDWTQANTSALDFIKNKPTIPSINNLQLAKAWVNFDGTGAVGNQTIRSQHNISSVSKTATGQYRVNFTSAMNDANYVVNGMAVQFDNTGVHTGVTACWNFTTTYFDLYTETIWIPGKDNAYFYNSSLVTVTIFGS